MYYEKTQFIILILCTLTPTALDFTYDKVDFFSLSVCSAPGPAIANLSRKLSGLASGSLFLLPVAHVRNACNKSDSIWKTILRVYRIDNVIIVALGFHQR